MTRLMEGERGKAEEAFAPLVGLPLTDMWRYLGCQKFEFGEQKPRTNSDGKETTWSDWGLVVVCSWRIEGPEGFVLSDEHFGPTPERSDDHAGSFYDRLEEDPLIVEGVEILHDGGLRFRLSDAFSFRVVPSPPHENSIEEWRLMPEGDPRGHLVLDAVELSWSSETTPERDTPE